MVFKLVRIDTQEPSKIQLLIGTHVIGRGKFLHDDDTDKRVSRNHAELEVTGDTVTLKSLHHNPCFYIKKSTDETQLLQQNCIISLCHGDKFGLIPDHFWYEVLHCTNQENMDLGNRIHESGKNGVESRDEGIEETDNNQIVEETEELAEQNDAASETSGAGEDGGAIEFEDIEEAPGSNRSASPVLMPADQECTEDYEVPPQVPSDIKTEKSPAKRSHSSRESSPVDAKKVKTEPNAGDVMAGPSNQPNNQQASSDLDSKVKTDASGSPVKPPLRERCIYGSNCYRRNPQHKAQFSHPSDGDWGGGARGACPYGRACRRHDPRHWDAHDHPPGVVQPLDPNGPRPGKRQKRRQRKVSESDEDSLVDDVIVTGKRARKTVNRQSWSGSESEGDEDPYKTDESDEWQPPSDVTNSQDFSQNF